MIKLIIFRDKDYYRLSKTILSPIVHDEGSVGHWEDPLEVNKKFKRFDWGKVDLCIEAGIEVSFRRATDEEIALYTEKLKRVRHGLMEDPNVDLTASCVFPVYKELNQDGFGLFIKKLLQDE